MQIIQDIYATTALTTSGAAVIFRQADSSACIRRYNLPPAAQKRGVAIASHISSVGEIYDAPFNPVKIDDELIQRLNQKSFPLINEGVESEMRALIEDARMNRDSVGGIIECCATGLEPGLGNPMFEGVESLVSSIMFGVPAVKGVEFGTGFSITKMRGSQSNDPYRYENGKVITSSNNNGGILGGITTGMPIIMRAAIKPTASISQVQNTVDLSTKENTTLEVHGRHDPCIVSRASVVIESALAIALVNLY